MDMRRKGARFAYQSIPEQEDTVGRRASRTPATCALCSRVSKATEPRKRRDRAISYGAVQSEKVVSLCAQL